MENLKHCLCGIILLAYYLKSTHLKNLKQLCCHYYHILGYNVNKMIKITKFEDNCFFLTFGTFRGGTTCHPKKFQSYFIKYGKINIFQVECFWAKGGVTFISSINYTKTDEF